MESTDSFQTSRECHINGINKTIINLKNKGRFFIDEFCAFQREMEDLIKEVKKLEQENLRYVKEIDKLESQLKELQKKIELMTKVISAPCIEEGVLKRVDSVRIFIFNKLIPEIDEMNLLKNEYQTFKMIENEYSYWEYKSYFPQLSGKPIIAFVGKFSSGKSSIINSFVGKIGDENKDLLPVDIRPETAVPTFITSNIELKNEIFYEDYFGRFHRLDYEIFSNLTAEKIRDTCLFKLMKRVFIMIKKSILSKYVILDTPGFCEESGKENEAIFDFVLDKADLIFFVVDICDGCLQKDSIEYIKKINVKKKNLYIVLNKIDCRSPRDRKNVHNKISEQIKEYKLDCNGIIEFSTRDKYKVECYAKLEDVIRKCVSYMRRDKEKEEKKFYDFILKLIDEALTVTIGERADWINKSKLIGYECANLESKIIENCKWKTLVYEVKQLIENNIYKREEYRKRLLLLRSQWEKLYLTEVRL